MKWLQRRRKETATTVMAELERARNLLFLSKYPETIDRIFDDITEIKSMLNQIVQALKFTSKEKE